APGKTITLDDGTTIRFDGYRQWATIQVSRDPAQPVVLGTAAGIVLGLLLSLAVRRRRVWLRATPSGGDGAPGRTVVAVGGLARAAGRRPPRRAGQAARNGTGGWPSCSRCSACCCTPARWQCAGRRPTGCRGGTCTSSPPRWASSP